MKPKAPKYKGLRNPAVVAAASSPAGREAIRNATEVAKTNAETGGKIAVFLVKVGVLLGLAYAAYRIYTHKFDKQAESNSYDPANITEGQAAMKAELIYTALYGAGADYDTIANAIAGLNYNGWIRLYNAFGKRPTFWGTDMTLPEWIIDQFSGEQLENLRSLVDKVF